MNFSIEAKSKLTKARAGTIATAHGDIPTPIFMPVGTQGTVKGFINTNCGKWLMQKSSWETPITFISDPEQKYWKWREDYISLSIGKDQY